jgi:hypothetical protein
MTLTGETGGMILTGETGGLTLTGETGGMTLTGETEVLGEKRVPVSFYPLQISHGPTWDRSRSPL